MKDLVRGFIRWLIIVLLVLNALVYWGVIQAKCQEHIKLHTDRIEWQDSGGWMFITVTSKNEDTVYYKQTSKREVKIASLLWDKNSRLDDSTKRPFEGCYFTLYCKKHLVIYLMARVPCFEDDLPPPKL